MIFLGQIIFWISIFGLVHTYVLYPLLINWLSKNKKPNQVFYESENLPMVSVLMSLYNEENMIAEKMESLFQLDYPAEKIQFYIGSDCSDDQTNTIVDKLTKEYSNFHFYAFKDRRGKPSVINDLKEAAYSHWKAEKNHIIIVTDASVLLKKEVIQKLVRHFKNEKIDLVDAHMVHFGMSEKGISEAENQYISSEVNLKYGESLIWKKMIGPFGGCYAVRSTHFSKVPPNRLVDDFYIAMKVFEKGGGAINDLEAICEEPVSHDIWVEYKRKARISAGNFQNMFTFWKLWFPPFKLMNFAFFSHKILRWLGPFLLILSFLSCTFLAIHDNLFFKWVFGFQLFFFLGFPIFDALFKVLNINNLASRKVTYFLLMNVALFKGFFRYLNGIESGTWSPTKREKTSNKSKNE
jgi:cellulose synthase/poly-beta-1,6-N-acetylglucosamine synthase-like glycosyltransferase